MTTTNYITIPVEPATTIETNWNVPAKMMLGATNKALKKLLGIKTELPMELYKHLKPATWYGDTQSFINKLMKLERCEDGTKTVKIDCLLWVDYLKVVLDRRHKIVIPNKDRAKLMWLIAQEIDAKVLLKAGSVRYLRAAVLLNKPGQQVKLNSYLSEKINETFGWTRFDEERPAPEHKPVKVAWRPMGSKKQHRRKKGCVDNHRFDHILS